MLAMQEAGPLDGGEPAKRKVVYSIIDKGRDKKPYWMRIGAAYVNRDGSFTLYLDALPFEKKLHVRDDVPYEEWKRMNEEKQRNGDERPGGDERQRLGDFTPLRGQNGGR